jgi:hypothetical protein
MESLLETLKKEQIASLQAGIDSQLKDLRNTKIPLHDRRQIRKAVEEDRRLLARMQDPAWQPQIPRLESVGSAPNAKPFEVGMVGRVHDVFFLQILSPTDSLIRIYTSHKHFNPPTDARFTASRLPKSAFMETYSVEHIFWLSAFPTDGLVDRKMGYVNRVCQITGTRSYTTANGSSNTVFVLESWPTSD